MMFNLIIFFVCAAVMELQFVCLLFSKLHAFKYRVSGRTERSLKSQISYSRETAGRYGGAICHLQYCS